MFLLNTAILFVLGFALLIYGADMLVRGALGIVRRLNVSEWVAGVLVLGFGTSVPELTIMMTAAFTGSDVGLGTIIGSNTFNILFILGTSALVSPLVFEKQWLVRDMPILLGATFAAACCLVFPLVGNAFGISRGEGFLLLLLGVFWVYALLYPQQRAVSDAFVSEKPHSHEPYAVLALLTVGGLVAVLFGGTWVVSGATAFARAFGVSESLIGLSLVGIGTSLPELAVTLSAVRKGSAGLAAGNIIGSNTLNFLLILPFAAVLSPRAIAGDGMFFDLAVTALASLACFAAVAFALPPFGGEGKSWIARVFARDHFRLSRVEGALLVCLYVCYLAAIVLRG